MAVINNFRSPIWVKAEDGEGLHRVEKSNPYSGDQDGIAIPWLKTTEVLKTVNSVDIVITSDGHVQIGKIDQVLQDLFAWLQEHGIGNGSGWKTLAALGNDWAPIFNALATEVAVEAAKPISQKLRETPFDHLWKAYPRNVSERSARHGYDGTCADLTPDNNQCILFFYQALKANYIHMKVGAGHYQGKICQAKAGSDATHHGLPRNSTEFVLYLARSGLQYVQIDNLKGKVPQQLVGKRGIVYFEDINRVPVGRSRTNHIDLWNGIRGRYSENLYFKARFMWFFQLDETRITDRRGEVADQLLLGASMSEAASADVSGLSAFARALGTSGEDPAQVAISDALEALQAPIADFTAGDVLGFSRYLSHHGQSLEDDFVDATNDTTHVVGHVLSGLGFETGRLPVLNPHTAVASMVFGTLVGDSEDYPAVNPLSTGLLERTLARSISPFREVSDEVARAFEGGALTQALGVDLSRPPSSRFVSELSSALVNGDGAEIGAVMQASVVSALSQALPTLDAALADLGLEDEFRAVSQAHGIITNFDGSLGSYMAAANFAMNIFGVDEGTQKTINRVAQAGSMVSMAMGLFSTGGLGSLGLLGAGGGGAMVLGNAGSLLGGNSPSPQVMQALAQLSDQIRAMEGRIMQRFDRIEELQLETLNLLKDFYNAYEQSTRQTLRKIETNAELLESTIELIERQRREDRNRELAEAIKLARESVARTLQGDAVLPSKIAEIANKLHTFAVIVPTESDYVSPFEAPAPDLRPILAIREVVRFVLDQKRAVDALPALRHALLMAGVEPAALPQRIAHPEAFAAAAQPMLEFVAVNGLENREIASWVSDVVETGRGIRQLIGAGRADGPVRSFEARADSEALELQQQLIWGLDLNPADGRPVDAPATLGGVLDSAHPYPRIGPSVLREINWSMPADHARGREAQAWIRARTALDHPIYNPLLELPDKRRNWLHRTWDYMFDPFIDRLRKGDLWLKHRDWNAGDTSHGVNDLGFWGWATAITNMSFTKEHWITHQRRYWIRRRRKITGEVNLPGETLKVVFWEVNFTRNDKLGGGDPPMVCFKSNCPRSFTYFCPDERGSVFLNVFSPVREAYERYNVAEIDRREQALENLVIGDDKRLEQVVIDQAILSLLRYFRLAIQSESVSAEQELHPILERMLNVLDIADGDMSRFVKDLRKGLPRAQYEAIFGTPRRAPWVSGDFVKWDDLSSGLTWQDAMQRPLLALLDSTMAVPKINEAKGKTLYPLDDVQRRLDGFARINGL